MPKINREAFGRAVKAARNKADMTLDELAEKSGVGRRTLSVIESGDGNPRLNNIHSIVHATGVSILELWAAVCEDHTAAGLSIPDCDGETEK